jgi:hypothetical protein
VQHLEQLGLVDLEPIPLAAWFKRGLFWVTVRTLFVSALAPFSAPLCPRQDSVLIEGNVPLENWTEVFRCFISPATRMGVKSLQLGITIKLVAQNGHPLAPDSPELKSMREAAKQLGLHLEEDRG